MNKIRKYINQIIWGDCLEILPQFPDESIDLILTDPPFSKEDDIVLDPFIGSGTTAIACIKLNRKFIGIEIDPEYCHLARKRINDERNQLRLDFKKVKEQEVLRCYNQMMLR